MKDGDIILEVIQGMTAGAWRNRIHGYTVAIGYRHEGWVMHLSRSQARELHDLLGEVIQAAEEAVQQPKPAQGGGR